MSLTYRPCIQRCLWHTVILALSLPFSLHAATEREPSAHFNDGWRAFEAGEYRTAATIWTTLAESGHVNAQVNIGYMYDHGTGIEQDYQSAAHWYRAAALQNSAAGQYNLSLLITEGKARSLAGRSAHYWMEKAAEQGFSDARQALDRNNENGKAPAALRESLQPDQDPRDRGGLTKPGDLLSGVPVSIGTAWPITREYAVTSHHIIDGKKRITLITSEEEQLLADVIVADATRDVALLRVAEPYRLPQSLPLAPSAAPLGASVFTIGFPRIDIMGKSPKLSNGIVSATSGLGDDPSRYQISVPIQQGNSGGPLLNMRGEVVGMITTMLGEQRPGGGAPQPIPNVGYALKADAIRPLLEQVLADSIHVGESRPADDGLEELASRVKDSILTVMAE